MAARRYTLSASFRARQDLADIRRYTAQAYGSELASAYSALLRQAFRDLRADPFRPGSKERPEIGENVRSYHTAFSRQRAGSDIGSPRHFILYYVAQADEIVVSRVLHDASDIRRHVPRSDVERARGIGAGGEDDPDAGGND